MDFLTRFPYYDRYLSAEELDDRIDELAKEFPANLKVLDLGETAGRRRIRALKIGSGSHNALLYGFPNPEEPLGGLLLDEFSNDIVANDLVLEAMDYTWYIIMCADPDGAALNERYLSLPYTPYNFALNFYRTPINRTGSMAFPYRYGSILDVDSPTAETLAMMKIMDENPMDLMCGLHVLRFGGVTYQVSEPCPELYARATSDARKEEPCSSEKSSGHHARRWSSARKASDSRRELHPRKARRARSASKDFRREDVGVRKVDQSELLRLCSRIINLVRSSLLQ